MQNHAPRATPCALAIILAATVALPPFVQASDSLAAVNTCLSDNTTGRDRKDLAKWVFLTMAAHPEIRGMASFGPDLREGINVRMGALFTRLVSEQCPDEIRAMLAEHGSASMGTAFESLGRIAMEELMGHPDVAASVSEFERHVDQGKIGPVLAPGE